MNDLYFLSKIQSHQCMTLLPKAKQVGPEYIKQLLVMGSTRASQTHQQPWDPKIQIEEITKRPETEEMLGQEKMMPQKQSETIIPPLTATRCPFYCLAEMTAMMMVCYYIIQIFSTKNEEANTAHFFKMSWKKRFYNKKLHQ